MQEDKKYSRDLIISIVALTLAVLAVGTLYVRDLFDKPERSSSVRITNRPNSGSISDAPAPSKNPEKEIIPVPEEKSSTENLKKDKKVIQEDRSSSSVSVKNQNGRITLYSTCTDCGKIFISIDEKPAGSLNGPYGGTGPPECNGKGAFSTEISSGRHHISASDDSGHNADIMISVTGNKCLVQEIRLR